MPNQAILDAKQRVQELWRWPSVLRLLQVAGIITIIISLFEIRLSWGAMLKEVGSNFITCASITFVTATLCAGVGEIRLGKDWKRLALLLVLLAIGGTLGGLLSWGINDLLFGTRMSHPWIYILVVASLTIIFGLVLVSYETIESRLAQTASRLAEAEVAEQRLLRLKTEAELEALRARVDPHFLFNTLNSIASLIPSDPARAEELVQRLADLFRSVLGSSDRALVPLREELEILTEYLEIERARLGKRLRYTIDCEEHLKEVSIPSMLLQPLVENSVKYGIATAREGGEVHVVCRARDGSCHITVEDSGPGFDPALVDEGFGIASVRKRLELHYPRSHEFTVDSTDGVRVHIAVPLDRASSDEVPNDPR